MPRLKGAFLLVIVASLTIAVGGCAAPELSQLPHGIHVSVQQNRSDSADRRLQLRFTNDTDVALTVASVKFSSPDYSPGVYYPNSPATVRANSILDLPVILPAPVCAATDSTPSVSVDFTYAHQPGHATLTPTDPLRQLPGIRSLDCLNDSMARIATMTMPDRLRTVELSGKLVAMIDVGIAPTGVDASFTITAVERTILISPVAMPDPTPVNSLPLNIVVNGTSPASTLTIPIVPIRCDDHAQADDKRGTLLPLRITIGDLHGISYLGVTPHLKAEIFNYLQSSCTYR